MPLTQAKCLPSLTSKTRLSLNCIVKLGRSRQACPAIEPRLPSRRKLEGRPNTYPANATLASQPALLNTLGHDITMGEKRVKSVIVFRSS